MPKERRIRNTEQRLKFVGQFLNLFFLIRLLFRCLQSAPSHLLSAHVTHDTVCALSRFQRVL